MSQLCSSKRQVARRPIVLACADADADAESAPLNARIGTARTGSEVKRPTRARPTHPRHTRASAAPGKLGTPGGENSKGAARAAGLEAAAVQPDQHGQQLAARRADLWSTPRTAPNVCSLASLRARAPLRRRGRGIGLSNLNSRGGNWFVFHSTRHEKAVLLKRHPREAALNDAAFSRRVPRSQQPRDWGQPAEGGRGRRAGGAQSDRVRQSSLTRPSSEPRCAHAAGVRVASNTAGAHGGRGRGARKRLGPAVDSA